MCFQHPKVSETSWNVTMPALFDVLIVISRNIVISRKDIGDMYAHMSGHGWLDSTGLKCNQSGHNDFELEHSQHHSASHACLVALTPLGHKLGVFLVPKKDRRQRSFHGQIRFPRPNVHTAFGSLFRDQTHSQECCARCALVLHLLQKSTGYSEDWRRAWRCHPDKDCRNLSGRRFLFPRIPGVSSDKLPSLETKLWQLGEDAAVQTLWTETQNGVTNILSWLIIHWLADRPAAKKWLLTTVLLSLRAKKYELCL